MIFPASMLQPRINGLPGPFPLRSVTGAALNDIEKPLLEVYIEAGVICARGSNQKLKYFQFIADEAEVARVLEAQSSKIGDTRARPPLDFLTKMASDRKTTITERFTVVRGGRTQSATVHAHKPVILQLGWSQLAGSAAF